MKKILFMVVLLIVMISTGICTAWNSRACLDDVCIEVETGTVAFRGFSDLDIYPFKIKSWEYGQDYLEIIHYPTQIVYKINPYEKVKFQIGKTYTVGIKNIFGYYEIKILDKNEKAVKIDKYLGESNKTNWFRITDLYDVVEVK